MFGFGKKKDDKPKPFKTETDNADTSEDKFDGDKSNDVKVLRKEEPGWKGLKRQYIYYVLGVLCLILIGAIFSGLSDDEKRAQEAEQRRVTEVRDSKAVSGDHLLNIPKDYKEQAEREAQKKRDEERMKSMLEDKDKGKEPEKVEAPAAPQVPQQPYQRHELTPAEKAELMRLEIKRKALESPIGFELKEEGKR